MSCIMPSPDPVRSYFDREAERFDAIYDERKPLHQRLLDRARRVVVERWKLICTLVPCRNDWTALDVGCGSGRYSIEFARRGAARVVGVDLAPAMIALAQKHAEEAAVAGRTDFVVGSFLEFQTAERFDVIVAAGYFDYLEDPVAHLRKMAGLCRGHIYVTVPKRWEVRVPLRIARFALARGFVRFYSEREFRLVAQQAGVSLDRLSMIDLGRDWVAVLRIGGQ
jgi:2-polyprenyl-3-methyl-5-hydroxy-6-metoxy-1,4-benzoquinol methylase